jgi:hypothetical protein
MQVEDLGLFLREKQVQPTPDDSSADPHLLAEIQRMILDAAQTCMQALNLGGIKLQSLIDAVNTRQGPTQPHQFACQT